MKLGIALGSNLGDRLANLRFGRDQLSEHLGPVLSAGIFETEPVGCPPGSPSFLNTVVEFDCDLDPRACLELTQSIQRAAGRESPTIANAPRPLDLDLLYLGDTILDTPELILPHPRLHLRCFVLAPLAEISPDLILPTQTRTIQQLLTDLEVEESDPLCVARDW